MNILCGLDFHARENYQSASCGGLLHRLNVCSGIMICDCNPINPSLQGLLHD
jgi:hypothetical protein